MGHNEAEDAGGLTPAKDGNEAVSLFSAELYRFLSVLTINGEMINGERFFRRANASNGAASV